jgi:lysozyme
MAATMIPAEKIDISDAGIAQLVGHEGVVPTVYYDSKDILTIFIGHTAAAGPPDPASRSKAMPTDLDAALEEAFAIFKTDLKKYCDGVRKALAGMLVRQYEFDAAVSFHYNTGAIATAQWVKTWRAGDYVNASKQIMNWKSPPEVIPRREDEQALWTYGTYSQTKATVWKTDGKGHNTWTALRTLSQTDILSLMGTPVAPPEPVKPVPLTASDMPLVMSGSVGNPARIAQSLLTCRGFDTNGIDGQFGQRSVDATMSFQRYMGLTDDGKIGYDTWYVLLP